MIKVNDHVFKTLDQDFTVNGKKVLEAYCNGQLVYPEREDVQVMKIIGNVNLDLEHSHAHDVRDYLDYRFEGEASYRAKACFSMVIRTPSSHPYQFRDVSGEYSMINISAAPDANSIFGGYANDYHYGDVLGRGNNVWVLLPHILGEDRFVDDDSMVHPLLGSPEIATKKISMGYGDDNWRWVQSSVEILFYLDISAPIACGMSCSSVGEFYDLLDETRIPDKRVLSEIPPAVNGYHRVFGIGNLYDRGINFTFKTGEWGSAGVYTYSQKDYQTHFLSRLSVCISGYPLPCTISGRDQITHEYREYKRVRTEYFNLVNIPFTRIYSYGNEETAPKEALHPRKEDIQEFI